MSGLAAASEAELGLDSSGWVQGRRAGVLLERGHSIGATPQAVPFPSPSTRADAPLDVTVVDVGWPFGQLLAAPGWLRNLVTTADPVVLVTTCTVRGVARLDSCLAELGKRFVVGVVVGPPRRSWPKAVQHVTGPHVRALDQDSRLVTVPFDRRLAVAGLDNTPLPGAVLNAAADVLNLVQAFDAKGPQL